MWLRSMGFKVNIYDYSLAFGERISGFRHWFHSDFLTDLERICHSKQGRPVQVFKGRPGLKSKVAIPPSRQAGQMLCLAVKGKASPWGAIGRQLWTLICLKNEIMANPGTPPNMAPHPPAFLAASIPSHLIFFLENCGKTLRSFCFHVEVNAALEMTFNWQGEGMTSWVDSCHSTLFYGPARDGHRWQRQKEFTGAPLMFYFFFFLSCISTERSSLGRKEMPNMSWLQMRGKHTNLPSLQVEGLHLPNWLVPKAGSLLPASTPQMSWQMPKQHIYGISSVSLRCNLAEWNVTRWKGTGEAWVGLNYTRTLAMKIKPDPRGGLKSFFKFPSCFLFHILCFVCLILWLHGSCGIGSKAIPQKKVNWACGVSDGAKPKKHWKYPLPDQGCEISSLIARPEWFGVMCGPPQYKPLPALCLLFQSSVSDIDFLG